VIDRKQQSIATSVQDRHYTMMSGGRTLHRADVMHACYSVSAEAVVVSYRWCYPGSSDWKSIQQEGRSA
jgi:hypothetical protein